MKSTVAYLGLGSNVGDRIANLREALTHIAGVDGINLVRLSPVYQTEPVGYEAQEDFYNMVAQVKTTLDPTDLLAAVKRVERSMGRVETVHKGPRVIDIDILLFGEQTVDEYKLSIPHPQILEREFVLRPLYDLDPDLKLAPLGLLAKEALASVEGLKRVTRLEESIALTEVTDD